MKFMAMQQLLLNCHLFLCPFLLLPYGWLHKSNIYSMYIQKQQQNQKTIVLVNVSKEKLGTGKVDYTAITQVVVS